MLCTAQHNISWDLEGAVWEEKSLLTCQASPKQHSYSTVKALKNVVPSFDTGKFKEKATDQK